VAKDTFVSIVAKFYFEGFKCKNSLSVYVWSWLGSLFVYMVEDVKEIKTVQNWPFKENWTTDKFLLKRYTILS
jgi:hypothetical protein